MMKRIFSTLSIVLIFVALSSCGLRKDSVPCHTIVCSENGRTEYRNTGKGIDENSVYELGSIGKTVAAYTALAMVDDGTLALDEKISPYLDGDLVTDDPRMNDITVRELICHTAGFSPSFELGVDKKIYSDPGTEFRYSGVGYIYLQSVIENAGGMSMEQAASRYVFGPLGMKNSTFEKAKTITPYMNLSSAVLYSLLFFVVSFILLVVIALIAGKLTGFKYYRFKTAFLCCFFAASVINTVLILIILSKVLVVFLLCFMIMGIALLVTRKHKKLFYIAVPAALVLFIIIGFAVPVTIPTTNDLLPQKANCAYTFRSTGKDMALFCDELMRVEKERAGAFAEMFTPAVEIDDRNAWGLGVAIEYTSDSEPMYWHSGINNGFHSLYVLYPKDDKYIVVLTNSDRGLDFARESARAFLDVPGDWDIRR